jgi:hypothetical protein
MKQRIRRAAAPTAAIRHQIIGSLTQASFAVTLARRLSKALATVQLPIGVLVILDKLLPRLQLVEELRATEDSDWQPVLLRSPAEHWPKRSCGPDVPAVNARSPCAAEADKRW